MHKKFTWIVYALVLAGAMASCDLADPKDAIIVSDVEDEFYIDMWERLDDGRNFVLKIESIKPVTCLNYRIDYFSNRNGNRLTVSLNDIIEPTDCKPGEAAVKADVPIGSLPSGNYALDIDFRNTVVNKGQLYVNSESYLLTMKTENGIVLLREELLRVPNDLIWGYVATQQGANEAAAQNFMTDLQGISNQAIGLRVGYYGHFTINESEKVFVPHQPTDGSAQTFLWQYRGSESVLKSLLADYRSSYGNDLEIKLFNSKGETL